MQGLTNKSIVLKTLPKGKPTPEIFLQETRKVNDLSAGQFLMRNVWIAIDPALISRLRPGANYAEGVRPGQVMQAYGIGQVIETHNPKVKVGELRLGLINMQEYSTHEDENESNVINTGIAPANYYLGGVGSTGMTAYFSIEDICQLKKGETIVISAGGSSVGSIVAQLAKMKGCCTIGIVSTEEKAIIVKDKWKYDAVVSYRNKSMSELRESLTRACPNGVDVYYDNTSGDISEALIGLYNDFARIAVIGRLGLSHLEHAGQDQGRRDNDEILVKRIKKQGFVLLDYKPRFLAGILFLSKMIKQGKLTVEEDILEGIDNLPTAFFRMLNGLNKGKQLVKLADIDHNLDPAPRKMGKILIADWFPTKLIINHIVKKKINS